MSPCLPLRLLLGRLMAALSVAVTVAAVLATLFCGLVALASAIGLVPVQASWTVWGAAFILLLIPLGGYQILGTRPRHIRLGYAHHYQGHTYLDLQQEELAIPHLEAAVDNFSKVMENKIVCRNVAIDLDDLGLAYERLGQNQKSLECRSRSLAYFESLNAVADQALVWHAMGNLYRDLDRPADSEQAYTRALALAQQANISWVEAACLDDLADFQEQRGQYSQAVAMRQRAMQTFRLAGKPDQESLVQARLGQLYLMMEDIPGAVSNCEQAIQVAWRAPATAEVRAMLVLGAICTYCEDWLGAKQYLRYCLERGSARDLIRVMGIGASPDKVPVQAVPALSETGISFALTATDTPQEEETVTMTGRRDSDVLATSTLYLLGLNAARNGEINSPYLVYYQNLWDSRQALLPNLQRIPEADDLIGAGRVSLHGLEKALEMGKKCLAQLGQSQFEDKRIAALRQHGAVCAIAEDWETAHICQEEALELACRHGKLREAAAAWFSLGMLALAQGDNSVENHIKELQALVERLPGLPERFEGCLRVAYLAFAGGWPERARQWIQQAQALARQTGDAMAEMRALALLGYLQTMRGEEAEAKDWFSQALEVVETVNSNGPAALRLHVARARCTMHLDEPESALMDWVEAMTGLESTQQRLVGGEGLARLVHYLPTTRAQVGMQLVTALIDRGDYATAYRQIERQQAAVLSHLLGQRLLFDPQGNLLRRAVSSPASLRREALLQPLDEAAVWTFLQAQPDRVVLAQYAVTHDRTYLFIFSLSEGHLRVHNLPVSASHLRSCLARFEKEVCAYRQYPEPLALTWQETASELVAPLASYLPDCDRLLIIPDGILHRLPLHAALLKGRPLIAHCPVSYAPSAASAFHCWSNSPRRWETALVVGNPAGELVHVSKEVVNVARLFDVQPLLLSEARMRLWAQPHQEDVLHIATHGYFDDQNPFASGLIMSDGLLTTALVQEMSLAVQLVTLSACETGITPLSSGQELVGFSSAFLAAGAPSVLVSLWAVDDEASAALMQRLYTLLKAGSYALADALRTAQLELARQPRWSHPYFWAPFVLVGDGR